MLLEGSAGSTMGELKSKESLSVRDVSNTHEPSVGSTGHREFGVRKHDRVKKRMIFHMV